MSFIVKAATAFQIGVVFLRPFPFLDLFARTWRLASGKHFRSTMVIAIVELPIEDSTVVAKILLQTMAIVVIPLDFMIITRVSSRMDTSSNCS